jgi:hypothetical protein
MSNVELVARMVTDDGGCDLEEEFLGEVEIDGWSGLPTKLYSYSKRDRDGARKNGLAAMLNPDAEQIARWVVCATEKVMGRFDERLAKRLVTEAVNASGFQFLVRGVHLEAMDGAPQHKAYPFFNGVTVKLRGISDGYAVRPLTEDELRYTVSAPMGDVTKVGTYARIQSTSPQEYRDNDGKLETAGSAWLEVVRQTYIVAWGNDEYEMMTAKAKSLIG